MTSSPGWLSRYQRGQRQRVWLELRQVGSTLRGTGLGEEAQLVCDEMARRARQNIEVLVERLTEDGYRFHSNDDGQVPMLPHAPPTAGAAEYVQRLEDRFGAVPMTLSAWARIVGDVWFVGTHPSMPGLAGADPLVIELEGSLHEVPRWFVDVVDEEWDDWQERQAEDPDDEPFVLPVAPDHYHKNNTSGGGAYGFILPDGCVDGVFSWETDLPFVSYLNWVFSDGGFPRPPGDKDWWQLRRRLTKDLLPL
ncbi:hypothetical protein [Actinoplanes subglobosus]|uniref:Knr4/Smi1-like domain-containing protein n=1 Tax=Actinoplanes subglobosus TaxID=1547892 RepID=A0ABV8IWD7_9ACTN